MGDNVTIMQHVTLGGTGNERGDRHPKIGNHVQIGVKATILGKLPTARRIVPFLSAATVPFCCAALEHILGAPGLCFRPLCAHQAEGRSAILRVRQDGGETVCSAQATSWWVPGRASQQVPWCSRLWPKTYWLLEIQPR